MRMLHFAVFGSHPRISLAEIRALKPYLAPPLLSGSGAVFTDDAWDGDALMSRLGGTTKLGTIIATMRIDEISGTAIVQALPQKPLAAIDFGFTCYGGTSAQKYRFKKLPLETKKAFKASGIPSRWVTGKEGEDIAPAAIAKLHLTTDGFDLCLFFDGTTVHVGRTTHVQNADAWSLRDYGRPARSETKGMLPPKLARILVNLAVMPSAGTLLDPFCGSGTILMETALATQAAHIIGSDLDPKQISDTKKNISWLTEKHIFSRDDQRRVETIVADARKLMHIAKPGTVNAVVSEGYLGPLLKGNESLAVLKKNAAEISNLWRDTLLELKPLLTKKARLVCVWPAFKTTGGVARVDLEQDLPSLGYTLVDPFEDWNVPAGPLLYHRPGQHVMRRIVLIKQK